MGYFGLLGVHAALDHGLPVQVDGQMAHAVPTVRFADPFSVVATARHCMPGSQCALSDDALIAALTAAYPFVAPRATFAAMDFAADCKAAKLLSNRGRIAFYNVPGGFGFVHAFTGKPCKTHVADLIDGSAAGIC
jgi:hypothetical protein